MLKYKSAFYGSKSKTFYHCFPEWLAGLLTWKLTEVRFLIGWDIRANAIQSLRTYNILNIPIKYMSAQPFQMMKQFWIQNCPSPRLVGTPSFKSLSQPYYQLIAWVFKNVNHYTAYGDYIVYLNQSLRKGNNNFLGWADNRSVVRQCANDASNNRFRVLYPEFLEGACVVMVTAVENGYDDLSSNPGRICLNFTLY